MRYQTIGDIIFTNKNGVSVTLKDMREYPEYQKAQSLLLKEGEQIDEIATRPEFFGDEAEGESYKIVDFNIVRLFENNFEVEKLKEIDIPI